MHSPQPPAGPAASSARMTASSPRPPAPVPRPPSATHHHRPATPPPPNATSGSAPPASAAATAAPPAPALALGSQLPSPRGASASAAAASHVVAAAAAPAAAPASIEAATAAAAETAADRLGHAALLGGRPPSPSAGSGGHAVVPLVILPQQQQQQQPLPSPPPQIRAAHEMAGSSAGGGDGIVGGGGDGATTTTTPYHPGFGPLDTTDPTLTTDAVVPPSQVLCDGDFHALYLLGEQLGRGSYGTVHRCERRSDGALFAVKVLALAGFRGEHRLPEIEDEVRLWRRVQGVHDAAVAAARASAAATEAGGAASSSSSHLSASAAAAAAASPVVRLVSAHRDLTAAYLVQELCESGDLQGVVDRQAAEATASAAGGEAAEKGGFPGALSEPLAAAAMASVLRFIAACHDAGVVFGDVKPANFLLTLGGEDDEEDEDGAGMAAGRAAAAEEDGEGQAHAVSTTAAEAAAGSTATPTTTNAPQEEEEAQERRERRVRRRLLRMRGADFGTALALPSADGACSIHPPNQGGCACADLAFSLPASGGGHGGHGGGGGIRSSSSVVAAALASSAGAASAAAGSPPSPPPAAAPAYARECVPRRGLSGTPVFMAPELVRERRAGPAADVWAAGATAYLLLTGRFPFWPDVPVEELARVPPSRVLAEVAAAPLALEHPRATAHLSPEARGFLARLLERDPARRVTARAALAHPFLAGAVAEAEAMAEAEASVGVSAAAVVAAR